MAKGKRGVGDNNPPLDADPDFELPPNISGERLRSFIERIERLQAEIASLRADIKEIKSEAKDTGFDVLVITYLIKLRKQDADDRAEFETLVETYELAIRGAKK